MKKLLLTTLLTTATFTATAGGYNPTGRSFSDSNAVSSSNSYSTNTNVASPTANSRSVNRVLNGSDLSSNSRSVSKVLNGADLSSKQKNKQNTNVSVTGDEAARIPVATATAPSINPTATCMGSSTAGGQGMSIGLSMGSSWESENCMYLETARSFEQAGYKEDALAIRCQSEYAASAPSCKALNQTGGDPYSAEYWTN